VGLVPDGHIPFPCSKEEQKRTAAASDAWEQWALEGTTPAALSHQYGAEAATAAALLDQELVYRGGDIDRGAFAQMPLTAKDLIEVGMTPGPTLGKALAVAKDHWYSTDLRATKESLLIVAKDEVKDD